MNKSKIKGHIYNNILIVDDRNHWELCKNKCDLKNDLVLTYDLALKKELEEKEVVVYFIDHLMDAALMQENNFLIYDFFKTWHLDKSGNDIFVYKGVPFGFSFRLDFWNDYVEYLRLYINIKSLLDVEYKTLYIASNDKNITTVLEDLGIYFVNLEHANMPQNGYYFPIAKWMDEKIRPSGTKAIKLYIKEKLTYVYITLLTQYDRLFHAKRKHLYIHEYHPTAELVRKFKKENKFNVVLHQIRKRKTLSGFKNERYMPISGSLKKYEKVSENLFNEVDERKVSKLVLADGSDVSDIAYKLIMTRVSMSAEKKLKLLDSMITYTNDVTIDLLVLIANIGEITTLLHCVCQTKKIPSFLIINGMLGTAYLDESKYATVINSYSESIKNHYFRGMNNIVTLGDPRMDMYAYEDVKTQVNRHSPTVVIGASGFNSTDLNSYVSVEFDFMYDVLSAMRQIKQKGTKLKVIIKVRSNGYKQQYRDFVDEYFIDIVDEIQDIKPMREVLLDADFYMSIYSQTLFEASCLGIPVVYYKKDKEVKDIPFNGDSELVTVDSVDALVQAFDDFQASHSRYEDFLDRKVMEKYIGHLDGKNLERNKNFIEDLLNKVN